MGSRIRGDGAPNRALLLEPLDEPIEHADPDLALADLVLADVGFSQHAQSKSADFGQTRDRMPCSRSQVESDASAEANVR